MMHPTGFASASAASALLLVLAACDTGPPGGTFVGNPGEMTVRLTGPVRDGSVRVVMDVSGLELDGCSGDETVEVPISRSIDLLGDAATLPFPDGAWCVVSLQVAGIHLDASALGLEPIPLPLPVDRVRLYADTEVAVGGRAFVLELGDGGWVEVVIVGILASGSSYFGPADVLLDGLMQEIASNSLLFLDLDRDGRVDDEERALGPLAASR